MAKHNQSKTLGTLTDFQTAPPPAQETADERFVRLEHRLLQVETLLNDVMQQLDKPYRDQPHSNGETPTGETQTGEAINPQSEKDTESTNATHTGSDRRTKASGHRSPYRFSTSAPRSLMENDTFAQSYQRTLQPKQQASRLSDKTPSQNSASCDCKRCRS